MLVKIENVRGQAELVNTDRIIKVYHNGSVSKIMMENDFYTDSPMSVDQLSKFLGAKQ